MSVLYDTKLTAFICSTDITFRAIVSFVTGGNANEPFIGAAEWTLYIRLFS